MKTSSRVAAQRAQMAMKRTIEDVDSATDDEPTKRARSTASSMVKKAKSLQDKGYDSSEFALGSDVEDSQEEPVRTVLGAMAGIAKKGAASVLTKAAQSTLEPAGDPLVWANARGSLCEALPYFKAHKGSLHTLNRVAQGFLVDQEADKNDLFLKDVLVSSV